MTNLEQTTKSYWAVIDTSASLPQHKIIRNQASFKRAAGRNQHTAYDPVTREYLASVGTGITEDRNWAWTGTRRQFKNLTKKDASLGRFVLSWATDNYGAPIEAKI